MGVAVGAGVGAGVAVGSGVFVKNLEMVIEEPAWSYSEKTELHTRIVWTNILGREGRPALGGATYTYLPSVIMHEFGHTLGLTDLYNYTGYSGYLMDDSHWWLTSNPPLAVLHPPIPRLDIRLCEAGLPQRARHRAALMGVGVSKC